MKAFVFPGQGSQFVGMGKDLYDSNPSAKELFDKADDILGFKITDIMFAGTDEALKQTNVTQPAVFLHSVISALCMGYEYILLSGKNDSDTDARLLVEYMRHKHAVVNLIPVNPVPEKGFFRPSQQRINHFLRMLEKGHVPATVRREMGKDINAACGQLRADYVRQEDPTCL